MLDEVWGGLGGRAAALGGLLVEGPGQVLAGPLPSTELGVAAVASALLAAAELAEARLGHRPAVHLETEHVADAVRSERFLRIDGASTGLLFDPLSSYNRTADGWIRLHANYPHHRASLRAVLGLPESEDPPIAAVQARIATWTGSDLEDALVRAGPWLPARLAGGAGADAGVHRGAPPPPGHRLAVGLGRRWAVGRPPRVRQHRPGGERYRRALPHRCRSGRAPGRTAGPAAGHATGHLVAAAALPGLEIRETEGTAAHARASLAGTAAYLMSALDR